jgi:multiple sugar transport system ATP-binding protein
VLVVERLGGATLLHVKLEGGDLLTVQTDGESPVHMHDKVALSIASDRAHLFDEQGLAIPAVTRHPLADRKVRGGPAAVAK